MEPWIPPVVSGIFSIAVVVVGAVFIGKRERDQRREELDRATKQAQSEALANYLKAERNLAAQLLQDIRNVCRDPEAPALDPGQALDISTLQAVFYSDLLQELDTLDLSVHDPIVRKPLTELIALVKQKFAEFPSYTRPLWDLTTYENKKLYDQLLNPEAESEELRSARAALLTAARQQFRVDLPATRKIPGLYTPNS